MELMTGAEMFDGFERRLPIKKLDDATKSTAMERFGTYEKKGVIKGCSFEDDVWMLTDELRLVQFDFRFSHTAYEKNAREWVGCTASCFGDYMKSYVLLQLGTIGLLRLQQIIGEIKKAAVCDSENVGAEMDDKETQHLARFLSLIPDSNELRDSVIEELEARTVKLGNTKARDLSGFKNYLEFDRRMKDFWKIADEDDKMFYFPVFFWWNLTNILPLRATEFLMTPYDCITEENGKTFIRIRRTTSKKGTRRRGYKVREDFEIFTYEIPGWMYAEIEDYRKRTEIVSRPLLDTLLVSMGPTPRGYFTYGQMKLRLSRFCRDIMGDEEYPINLGDTRHLAMINLILSGGSPVICRELAGHEDINISSNYYANVVEFIEEKETQDEEEINILTLKITKTDWDTLMAGRISEDKNRLYESYERSEGGHQAFLSPFEIDWSDRITSGFGLRIHPISGKERFHKGIDIGMPEGTPVLSCSKGVVIKSTYTETEGNYVVVLDETGYKCHYMHLSERNVSEGDMVTHESIIGKVGSTGYSTGPHLHLQITDENNECLNPEFLVQKGN